MAESEPSATIFTNDLYDKLKFIALILLPAVAALYFGLGQIWDFPNTERIVGTLTVIDTFLGGLLKFSTDKYYKSGANFDGDVIVTPEDGGNRVTMAFNGPPEDMVDAPGKHSMEFRIKRQQGVDVG